MADQGNAHVVAGKARPLGAYPHVRIAGGFAFVSGTSARQADDSIRGATVAEDGSLLLDVREQTAAVIDNVTDILASIGLGLGDVVDVTTFLVDMADFAGYNEVYGSYFGAAGPARTTVAVAALPHPHLCIEMKVVALVS